MDGAEWVLETILVLLLAAVLFHALRLERALGVLKRDRAVLEGLVAGFNESTRQAETGVERLRLAADGAGRQMARQIETAQRLRDDLTFFSDRSEKLAERLESAVRAARMLPEAALLQGTAIASGLPVGTAGFAAPASPTSVVPPSGIHLSGRAPSPAPDAEAGDAGMDMADSGSPEPVNGAAYSGHGSVVPAPRRAALDTAQAAQAARDAERLAAEIARHVTPPTQPLSLLSEAESASQPRLRSQAERDLLRALRGSRRS